MQISDRLSILLLTPPATRLLLHRFWRIYYGCGFWFYPTFGLDHDQVGETDQTVHFLNLRAVQARSHRARLLLRPRNKLPYLSPEWFALEWSAHPGLYPPPVSVSIPFRSFSIIRRSLHNRRYLVLSPWVCLSRLP
jgi:hypothetical protein